ncbi:hypothetical protein [uncultured Reyranella sp.]|uniref:hypothetical protein n=1 Tax=uncultured Reyranella sp. TaxID=735512 RepID=UPI0025FD7BC7|nr:hypothetical protein [uncultured Reyranella sp.]
MMLRHSLLLGVATIALAGTAHAQQRGGSRDDLLDALTRHIQICSEITETQARLSCYDRLQTQVGGVQAPAAAPVASTPAPTPTPLQATPTPLSPMPSTGSSISAAPLTPQPLGVPGGGTATLGSPQPLGAPTPTAPAAAPYDPNAAFDPSRSTYRPPEAMGPKPQPQARRSGPRPVPNFATPQPLVTIGANNLTYGPSRYWQVTIVLKSNVQRAVDTQAVCTFMNGSRALEDAYYGPVSIQPGEQITTELIGPPTTAYVDSTNCRLLSP